MSTATLFTDILAQGIRKGQIPARTKDAREWYRATAKKYGSVDESQLLKSDRDRLTNNPQFGSMYFFNYDAKHKDTLPYWDRFPLIFPFQKAKGGFKGLNMHYLPLPLRAKLMDSLYTVASDDNYDEKTKLKLSYDVLNGASKFKYFQPTVHHYLWSQFRSRFLYIYPSEWDISIFLPLERFQGATKTQVWKDTREMVRG